MEERQAPCTLLSVAGIFGALTVTWNGMLPIASTDGTTRQCSEGWEAAFG